MMTRRTIQLPEPARPLVLAAFLALMAGLAAVAFMVAINRVFTGIWQTLAGASPLTFVLGSFAVISLSSLLVGWLLGAFAPEAAGSGIPQLKAAISKDFGVVKAQPVWIKFIAGIVSIGGGASLGREGPTVYVCGGVASTLAAWLGVRRQNRRAAASAGAAAGLAAAFNTPLAAITFVLEELVGDLNSRLLGTVVLASVVGAFVVHALIGRQPAFEVPPVAAASWSMYLAVPLVAAVAALAGVAFQRASLDLRERLRASRWPAWARPLLGGWITWALAVAVFLTTGRLGVLGLGYEDLSDALARTIDWRTAGILLAGKLVATTACYGFGGCGGIFSPTLFMGGMAGFLVAGILQPALDLTTSDQIILAAVGMSACFGAAVRAPMTAILMIFEMTHQFELVPGLMLGTLVSQAIARSLCRANFYEEVLLQDGHALHTIKPPRDFGAWRHLPVYAVVNPQPVVLNSLAPAALREAIQRYPYQCFPVQLDDGRRGILTRRELESSLLRGAEPALEPAIHCRPDETLQAIESRILESPTGMMLVRDADDGPIVGLFTLHDLLRAQAAVMG
ncbi:MAG: chloride channel protein [Lentisphaerae bacterium]|nr:chloride channel protein [Lentisphaerota bacterium]